MATVWGIVVPIALAALAVGVWLLLRATGTPPPTGRHSRPRRAPHRQRSAPYSTSTHSRWRYRSPTRQRRLQSAEPKPDTTKTLQQVTVEEAGVEVDHAGGLDAEIGVTREDPGPVLPRLDREDQQTEPRGLFRRVLGRP